MAPLLGALALGAQRLLPALQLVCAGWATLKGYNASLAAVLAMLDQPMPELISNVAPLPLRQALRLEAVNFCYGPDLPEVLKGVTPEIRPGERIGLIGGTGSRKSTTVDLLMGLLAPTQGQVLVDSQDLHDPQRPELLSTWRASIAHVPQSIYLADSSIAENITFGVQKDQTDYERVRLAAHQAQIPSFIETSARGYETFVGERGVCLGGGQRQRIGIARALYKQANVLVFDDATSALANEIESAATKAVDSLTRELTIVIIAHHLTTVAKYDRVSEPRGGLMIRRRRNANTSLRRILLKINDI